MPPLALFCCLVLQWGRMQRNHAAEAGGGNSRPLTAQAPGPVSLSKCCSARPMQRHLKHRTVGGSRGGPLQLSAVLSFAQLDVVVGALELWPPCLVLVRSCRRGGASAGVATTGQRLVCMHAVFVRVCYVYVCAVVWLVGCVCALLCRIVGRLSWLGVCLVLYASRLAHYALGTMYSFILVGRRVRCVIKVPRPFSSRQPTLCLRHP
jgi:hypothetical protein